MTQSLEPTQDSVPSTVPADELERCQITFADGTEGRVYHHPLLDQPVPSVTTIKGIRVDPEKDDAIQGWRDHFDGSQKWKCPHYTDQKAYKGARGTLGHYAILSGLGELERSHEEDEAEYLLKNWASERPTIKYRGEEYEGEPVPDDMMAPVGNPAHYEGEDAWTHCMRDIDWVIEEFNTLAQDKGITEERVIEVEKYVVDEEIGYAGQFDLLYETPDGDVVLSDLKLSSGIRFGYKLQLAAYANALDEHVDRLEVIRLYPDDQEVEVETSEDWDRTVTGLCYEFLGIADRFHSEKTRPLDSDTLQRAVEEELEDD